ncbi:MAG: hypothetical protein R2744_11460 [Bacteroidales bacterium]
MDVLADKHGLISFSSIIKSGSHLPIILVIMTLMFHGCKKDDIEFFNKEELNTYLKSLPPISEAMPVIKDAEIYET